MMEFRTCVHSVLMGLTLCLVQSANVLAAAGEEAGRCWMQRVLNAGEQVSYEGTFVYRRGKQVETLQLVHQASGDTVREKLTALSGVPREIIRRDDALLYILPENQREHAQTRGLHRALATPSLGVAHLQDHYRFEVAGQSRTAGRPTVELAIRPRDDFRYGYRLWVDRESGLVLRSDLLNAQDEILEQVIFTHVRLLPEVPPDLLEPTLDGKRVRRPVRELRDSANAPRHWQVNWLPPGFVQRMHDRFQKPEQGHAVEHFVFEDGLARVSVFVEERENGSKAARGTASLGALNVFSRDAGSHGVVVVGDVPMPAVKRIAQAVAPQAGEQQADD